MTRRSGTLILTLTTAMVIVSGCTTLDPYTREEQTSGATKGALIGAGIGALLGLADPRFDILCVYRHAKYLLKNYWQAGISISFPRIRATLMDFLAAKVMREAGFEAFTGIDLAAGGSDTIVLEGSVEITVEGKTLEVSGPGSLFGEMALIDSSARSATARASENSKLAPVGERQFLRMVEQTPYFALHVMKVLTDRLRRIETLNRA